jgi:hypothetical protein
MTVSLRDHKMLWGRAAGKCSICKIPLARISDIGHSVIIGEEAHIVAKSKDQARGESPLTKEQRDTYSNLILLCPTHHTLIDDLPSGAIDYSVELLLEIKGEHECLMATQGEVDAHAQLNDEQWAALVDSLHQRLDWNDWESLIAPLLYEEGPALYPAGHRKLSDAAKWIYSRVWPEGHEELRETIETLGHVITDLLVTFEKEVEDMSPDARLWRTKRFYKITTWNPPLYDRLVEEYKDHVDLLFDLTLELTRYCNLVADRIRAVIDRQFRFEEGVFMAREGGFFGWRLYRPEFSQEERKSRQPYRGLTEFREDRRTRDISSRQTAE